MRPLRESQPPPALRRNNRQVIHIHGLRFGANDVGSIMIEENVVSSAGTFIYHPDESFILAESIFSLAEWHGLPALADDAGLCVDAFGGQPGVDTAYYATRFGYPKGDDHNVTALLEQMQGLRERGASMVSTLVALRSADDIAEEMVAAIAGDLKAKGDVPAPSMSAPPQNTLPPPVMTMAFTAASATAWSTPWAMPRCRSQTVSASASTADSKGQRCSTRAVRPLRSCRTSGSKP